MTLRTPTTEFLVRLHKIDQAGLKARDIVLLYAIIANPGINGKDLALKLGIPERSHIQHALIKLEERGLIEDRRAEKDRRKANPASFHILPAGQALWDDLKP